MKELSLSDLIRMKSDNRIRRAHGYLSSNGNFTVTDIDNNRFCVSDVGIDWIKGYFRVYKGEEEVFIKQPFDVKYRQPLAIFGLLVIALLIAFLSDTLIDTRTPENIAKNNILAIEQFSNSLREIDNYIELQKNDIIENANTLEDLKGKLKEIEITLGFKTDTLNAILETYQRANASSRKAELLTDWIVSFFIGVFVTLFGAMLLTYMKHRSLRPLLSSKA